jgi:aminobenzoyl-glutamate utilization protein B
MATFRPLMRKYYYDPDTYPTYLDQLGVKWPPEAPAAAKGG